MLTIQDRVEILQELRAVLPPDDTSEQFGETEKVAVFFSENYIAFSHHPSLLPPHTALTSRLTGYLSDYFSAHCLFSCFSNARILHIL